MPRTRRIPSSIGRAIVAVVSEEYVDSAVQGVTDFAALRVSSIDRLPLSSLTPMQLPVFIRHTFTENVTVLCPSILSTPVTWIFLRDQLYYYY